MPRQEGLEALMAKSSRKRTGTTEVPAKPAPRKSPRAATSKAAANAQAVPSNHEADLKKARDEARKKAKKHRKKNASQQEQQQQAAQSNQSGATGAQQSQPQPQ